MKRPTLAVHKFASCDGCQLSLLDLDEGPIALAEAFDIRYFPELSRDVHEGPYDVSIVEGSVTTPEDAARIRRVREQSGTLITIGACATAGGIQALRNFADVEAFKAAVYASPEFISTLATSTPIADHVAVDIELHGCPVDKRQLHELLGALRLGRKPGIAADPVCTECKRRGAPCVMVASGTPCLGPVTRAGCGAICPAYGRGCYGCFGTLPGSNTTALLAEWARLGEGEAAIGRAMRAFTAAPPLDEGTQSGAGARSEEGRP